MKGSVQLTSIFLTACLFHVCECFGGTHFHRRKKVPLSLFQSCFHRTKEQHQRQHQHYYYSPQQKSHLWAVRRRKIHSGSDTTERSEYNHSLDKRNCNSGNHSLKTSNNHQNQYYTNNNNKNNNNAHPFDNFLTNEKQRLENIIKFEKQRLDKINKFLDSERDRYTQLEKQEKKSLSTLVDDGVVGEWASSLMRVDSSLELSSRTATKPTSQVGWTKLILDPVQVQQTKNNSKNQPSTTTHTTASTKNNKSKKEEEFVYLYEPPFRNPSTIIMFLGGAGLGQFPHITYSELLSRLSNDLNAAIITAPYHIGLDHYEISKDTGVLLHRALAQCQQSGRYSSTIPKFFLGHSLGSKLFTISTAAMNDILGKELSGVGLISFNNFGFIETTKQVRTFTDNINVPNFSSKQTTKMIDSILDIAEQAVTMSGIEFSPSPKQTTERIIHEKYDSLLTSKTRLFVFDDDDLDSSYDFYKAVQCPDLISVSGLPGNHLSPNYIKIDLDDIDIPLEAQNLGVDATSTSAAGTTAGTTTLQSISYGDERNLSTLVDEVSSWIMGQGPTRGPLWWEEEEKKKKQEKDLKTKDDSMLVLR